MTETGLFSDLKQQSSTGLFDDLKRRKKPESTGLFDDLKPAPEGDGGIGLNEPRGFAGTGVPLEDVESVRSEAAKARSDILPGMVAGAVRLANTPQVLAEAFAANEAKAFQGVETRELPKIPEPELKTDVGEGVATITELGLGFIPLAGPITKVGRGVRNLFGRSAREAAEVTAREVVESAPGVAARTPIEVSDDVARLADEMTPEKLLAPQDALKVEGQTVRTLSVDEELARVQANVIEAGEFRTARRSGTSIEETKQAARELGMTEDDLLRTPAGTAYNAEQLEAAKTISNNAAERLKGIAPLLEHSDDVVRASAKERMLREYAIIEKATAVRSESGRAQRALREQGRPAQQVRRAIENIKKGGGTLEEQARLISTLDDPAQVAQFARNVKPATTGQKLMEVWINALLSGKALVVNPASNALVSAYTPVVRTVGAGISRIPGGGGETIAFREGLAQINGMIRSMRVASRDAWRIFLTDEIPPHLATTKIEGPVQKAIGGKLGKVVRLPGRVLQSQDAWFKIVNAGGEMEALAVRDAVKRGLKGDAFRQHVADVVANPPKKLWDQAWKVADTNTFTVPLKDQQGVTALTARLLQRGAAESSLVRFFFPFVRTPTNIFKYSAANSPIAPLLKDVRNQIAKGGADRSEALARMAIGTSIGFGAYELASSGRITGGGPADPARRRIWRMTHEPYSVKVDGAMGEALSAVAPEGVLKQAADGGWWVNYGRLEPLGSLFGGAADLFEISSNLTDKESEDFVEAATTVVATMFARQASQKTFINGATTLAKAATGEKRFIENLIEQSAGSVVPSGVAEIARANDPIVRDTRGAIDRMKSRLPGQSEELEPLLTLWGDDIKRGPGLINFLSPVYVNPQKQDPIATEMQRLGVSPEMPERQIGGVELTGPQYTRYVKLAGQPAKEELTALVKSPAWRDFNDFDREEIITEAIRSYRATARDMMLIEFPDLFDAVIEKQLEEAQ